MQTVTGVVQKKVPPLVPVVAWDAFGQEEVLACGHRRTRRQDAFGYTHAVCRRCKKCCAGSPPDTSALERAVKRCLLFLDRYHEFNGYESSEVIEVMTVMHLAVRQESGPWMITEAGLNYLHSSSSSATFTASH